MLMGMLVAATLATSVSGQDTVPPAPSVAPVDAATPATPATRWTVTSNVSTLNPSSSRGIATIDSVTMAPNIIGRMESATLVIRCQGNKRDFYVVWPDYLGMDNPKVVWRFDDGRVWNHVWERSTGGDAAGYWQDRQADEEIRTTRVSSRLVISMDNGRRSAHEVTFDLTGADAAISEAFRACSA